ncbi:8832_t:CDS:2 [Funneliformis geosporum]|nr:8832_t:CDS:2 [Funneliformis geosporum]
MTKVKGNTQELSETSKKADKPEKKERCSYSVDQKQIVVEYALKHGRNVAARLYKIDKSMVGRWVKASKKWNAEPAKVNWNSLRVGSGQKPLYEEAENKLHQWVSDQHKLGAEITNSNVRNRMYQILKQPDMKVLYPDAENDFKASSRWLAGFLSRKKLTVQRDRPVFKKRPVCDVVLREYRQDIKQLMSDYIDMLHVIRVMNNQSSQPAIMVHDGSMNSEGAISQKFASHNINLAVIPDGTILSVLQPMDVINKVFKDNLLKEWDKWNAITGIDRRATITEICGWIKADDAMQRLSRSQNEEFNNEYMVESEVEDEGNQIEKINEKTNEEPVTEIHEIFDKYMFTEADPLVASSSFIPSTMHPDHTQNHVQPSILRFNTY